MIDIFTNLKTRYRNFQYHMDSYGVSRIILNIEWRCYFMIHWIFFSLSLIVFVTKKVACQLIFALWSAEESYPLVWLLQKVLLSSAHLILRFITPTFFLFVLMQSLNVSRKLLFQNSQWERFFIQIKEN